VLELRKIPCIFQRKKKPCSLQQEQGFGAADYWRRLALRYKNRRATVFEREFFQRNAVARDL
jgi:hypothetical protein